MGVSAVCYLIAVILAFLATVGIGHPRFNLTSASIAFIGLGLLLGGGGFIR